MANQHHIIKRQIFDICFISDQAPFVLQNRISHLFHIQLDSIMNGLFNRLISEDAIVRFDNLDIDLGTIPYDQMERLLPEKMEEAMEKALKEKLSLQAYYSDTSSGKESSSVVKSSHLDMLSYFLITGTLPWWATGSDLTDLVRVMKDQLHENTPAVKALILKTGQFTYVRRRLTYQFPEEVIRAVIDILESDESGFIFEYHRKVIEKQQETRRIKDELSEVNRAVWLFILTFLLTERGSRFNQKMFVKSTLGQMAAHYHLHYEELLRLFVSPLNGSLPFKRSLPLLTQIINDLSAEQFPPDYRDDRADGKTEKSVTTQGDAVREEEDMIKYYLQSGSLPSWADDKDLRQFNAIFLKLTRKAPETIRRLIREMKNKQEGIQHIVFALDEEAIQGIIKLVEPANAEFIMQYMMLIRTIQKDEGNIHADQQSFIRSVRQFVLNYLLIERGSDFNARLFLESNIRQIAHRYNLQVQALPGLLVRVTSGNSTAPTQLRNVLSGLRKEYEGNAEIKNREFYQHREEQPVLRGNTDTEVQNKTLFDVLRFWMMHGFFPWWGKKYEGYSVVKIWEDMFRKAPDDLLLLVKFAGTDRNMMQRIAYQLPVALFLSVFAQLTEGMEAVKMYRFTEGLLTRIPRWKIKNREALQNILMIAWWDGFIATGYRTFDLNRFISLSIRRLSRWTGISAENLQPALFEMIRHYRATHPGELTSSQQKFVDAIARPPDEMDLPGNESPDIRTLVLQYIPPEKRDNEESILNESVRMLEYFLSRNKWPDLAAGMPVTRTDIFLKGLIRLLARERPGVLRSVLDREGYSVAARMQLHDVFSSGRNSRDNDIRSILQEFYEKDLLLYLGHVSGSRNGITGKEPFELLDEIVKHPDDEQHKKLLSSLLSSSAMSAFIAGKYEDEVFYRFIENMSGSTGKETVSFLRRVQELLASAIPDTLEREKMNVFFRQFSLHYMSGKLPGKTPSQFFALLFALLGQAQADGGLKTFKSLLQMIHTRWSTSSSLPEGLLTEMEEHLKHLIDRETNQIALRKGLTEAEQPHQRQKGAPPASVKSMDKPSAQVPPEEKFREREERKLARDLLETDEDTIYIHNAGLVLLHPFLSTYFKRTELTREGNFINDEAVFRGIHLLQFLVDGEAQHPEHELVLNKILCGLPVEEPVPAAINFTEQETEISLELLKVAISQWEKIGNTSIEGFRASFLRRDGALTMAEDNSWKLRIEQRGYDVLLQTLPWGIGMIRTPWMENFLYVEWA